MNRAVALFFIAAFLSVADLSAQDPAMAQLDGPRVAEIREKATVMGQAARDEFEQKQFAGQVRKLRDGLAKGEFNKVAALQSTLLNAIRREIGQQRAAFAEIKNPDELEDEAAKLNEKKPEKNRADQLTDDPKLDEKKEELARMERILTEIQGFTFKNDNREASEAKLKLFEEFAQILQTNMVEGYQKMGAANTGTRD